MKKRRAKAVPAPVAGSRQRLSASRQRQRLIDACISALHLYGPSQTTVEKVVAIAKLSPGIVRFYFKSKGAMLVASLRFLSSEFEAQVLEPVRRLRDSPVLALQRMVELYLDPVIASTRKVSVWYAFWGEATARQEYQEICGQKDDRFAALVLELVTRMIEESQQRHLNADAVALGLIGALEILWQGIAFQTEGDVDRAGARRRCMAYLASVFPGHFPAPAGTTNWSKLPADARHALERERCFARAWQLVGHLQEIPETGRLPEPGTRDDPRAGIARWSAAARLPQQLPPSAPRPGQGAERSFPGPYCLPPAPARFCTRRAALLIQRMIRGWLAMDLTTVAGLLFVSDGAHAKLQRAIR